MSDHKHIWEMCVCGAFREGRAVQDDGLPTAKELTAALERVWAMGWIAMPDHETKDISNALLDALKAGRE